MHGSCVRCVKGYSVRYVRPYSRYSSPEEIKNTLVANGNPPPRKRKILRNFNLLLPKFHFILPNFYFAPPWGNFVSSLTILDFLGRKEIRD